MLRFPHEYQLDAKDCGPACIKILAKYYGKYYTLQHLRDLCGITREGISFLDMSLACEKIGLRSLVLKLGWDELLHLPLPCVVHWKDSHFVVLYKITKKKVFVSDPAKGLLSYPIAQFKKDWLKDGEKWAVMAVEPMADFKQRAVLERAERKKTFENFLGYLTPYKSAFIQLFIVLFIVTLLQALLPFISKSVIDVGIQTNDTHFIYLVLIGNITIIICVLLSNMVRDWILLHITRGW